VVAVRAVVQRVASARVEVDGVVVGAVDHGLLVFVGVVADDGAEDSAWIARKLLSLRVFPDAGGRMNRSVIDVSGKLLLVSQFTLCADIGKGARPSFGGAMAPEAARAIFDALVASLRESVPVETGRFGAHMDVHLVNDGPVTLWLDSRRG
jgi:D-tyrosyl-tRNA(Tyr) deacylase